MIINHLIYYVNKRTLDVALCVGVCKSKEQEKFLLLCVSFFLHVLSSTHKIIKKKKSSRNNHTCSEVFRVKLQLLFDPVLYQKTEVGVRHWKTVTHIHLLFSLLCCKTDNNFTFSFDINTQNGLL